MNRISPVKFQGRFTDLLTASVEMDAAQHPGGISSEDLERLTRQVKDKFQRVTVQSDPYQFPATVDIKGNPETVALADQFLKSALQRDKVKFSYTA